MKIAIESLKMIINQLIVFPDEIAGGTKINFLTIPDGEVQFEKLNGEWYLVVEGSKMSITEKDVYGQTHGIIQDVEPNPEPRL